MYNYYTSNFSSVRTHIVCCFCMSRLGRKISEKSGEYELLLTLGAHAVSVCVCVCVCLSVCLSVKSHLTSGASVRP